MIIIRIINYFFKKLAPACPDQRNVPHHSVPLEKPPYLTSLIQLLLIILLSSISVTKVQASDGFCKGNPIRLTFIVDDSGSIDSTERAQMTRTIQTITDKISKVFPNAVFGIVKYSTGSYLHPGYYQLLHSFKASPRIYLPSSKWMELDQLPMSLDKMIDENLFTGGALDKTDAFFIFTDARRSELYHDYNTVRCCFRNNAHGRLAARSALPGVGEYERLANLSSSGNVSVYHAWPYQGQIKDAVPGMAQGDGTYVYAKGFTATDSDAKKIADSLCKAVDYSDAPASYGKATHVVTAGIKLGKRITAESESIQDADNPSDDALAVFPALTIGATDYILPASSLSAIGTGNLYAWVDFDGNGTFESNEFAQTTVRNNRVAGDLSFSGFTPPDKTKKIYARLRLTKDTLNASAFATPASDGEVEDHAIHIKTPVCANYSGQLVEADNDCDGIPNSLEWGIIYNELGTPQPFFQDTDGDGIPDDDDRDSDNDGIYDADEAGHGLPHKKGLVLGPRDEYGIPLAVSSGDGGITYKLADSDKDGYADYLSLDSDGDGCYDTLEGVFSDPDKNGLLGNGTAESLTVDALGLVISGGGGYATPKKTGSHYDFQNNRVKACSSGTNNKPPVITEPQQFSLEKAKAAVNNHPIGSVLASDPDGDSLKNWRLSSDSSGGGFTIDSDSGKLRVADSSRLARGDYTLGISVEDEHGLGATVTSITITISDEVNRAPVFTSGTRIEALEQRTDPVIDINSSDDKDSENNGLVYQLISGSDGQDNERFHLDRDSGLLSFKDVMSYDTPKDKDGNNVYQARVQVCDRSGGCAEQPLSITVTRIDSIRLNVRAYLLGAYRTRQRENVDAAVKMVDDLRIANLLPLKQPYGKAAIPNPNLDLDKLTSNKMEPTFYNGTETTTQAILDQTGRNAVVDWAIIELRQTRDLSAISFRQAVLIQRDGDISTAGTNQAGLIIDGLPAGEYYVALRHRNHLGVMTADKVYLSSSPTLVDFTDHDLKVAKAFDKTPGRIALHSRAGYTSVLWPGDINADNLINYYGSGSSDALAMKKRVTEHVDNIRGNANKALTGYETADLNMDGRVVFSGRGSDSHLLYQVVYFALSKRYKLPGLAVHGGMQHEP